jgi:hypothetical protein
MLNWVSGLLVGLWMGMACTSILEVEAGGCKGAFGFVVDGEGCWWLVVEGPAGVGFVAVGEVAVRWGMFLISL